MGEARVLSVGGVLFLASDNYAYAFNAHNKNLLKTYEGHTGEILCLAFASRTLFSAGRDGTCRCWDVPSGLEKWRVDLTDEGRRAAIWFMIATPSVIVTGATDQSLRGFSMGSGKALWIQHAAHVGAAGVTAFAHAPKASLGYSAGGPEDHKIRCWSVGSGKFLWTQESHTQRIWDLDVSEPLQMTFSVSSDGAMRAWHMKTGEPKWTVPFMSFKVHLNHPVADILYSPHADTFCLHAFDAATGAERWATPTHSALVQCVAVSPRGGTVFTCAGTRVSSFVAATGTLVWSTSDHTGLVTAVAYSKEADAVYSSGTDRSLRRWDPLNGEWWWTASGHSATVWNDLAHKEGLLFTGAESSERTLHAWEVASGQELWAGIHDEPVKCVEYSYLTNRVYTGGPRSLAAWDGTNGMKLWMKDVTVVTMAMCLPRGVVVTGSEQGGVKAFDEEGNELWSALSPVTHVMPGLTTVAGIGRFGVRCWDSVSGALMWESDGGSSQDAAIRRTATCVYVSGGAVPIVFVGFDLGLVRAWFEDNKQGEHRWEAEVPKAARVHALAYSTKRKILVVGTEDHALVAFHGETGAQLWRSEGHTDAIKHVRVSDENNLAVSASLDQSIKAWGLKTGKFLATLEDHPAEISALLIDTHTHPSILFSTSTRIIKNGLWRRAINVRTRLSFKRAGLGEDEDDDVGDGSKPIKSTTGCGACLRRLDGRQDFFENAQAFLIQMILIAVEFIQMASFAFQPATPWNNGEIGQTVSILQRFGLGNIPYLLSFITSIILVAFLIVVFWTQEAVQWRMFLNRAHGRWRHFWQVYGLAAQLLTSTAFIPIVHVLLVAFACNNAANGPADTLRSDDTVVCWRGVHFVYVAFAGAALILYIPIAIRLERVNYNLSMLVVTWRFWVWNTDVVDSVDEIAVPRPHPLCFTDRGSIFRVSRLAGKLVLSAVADFIPRYPLAVNIVNMGIAAAFVMVSLCSRPYYPKVANGVRVGLDMALLWTYACGLWVFVLQSHENSVPIFKLIVPLLPALIVPVAILGCLVTILILWCCDGSRRVGKVAPVLDADAQTYELA